MEFLTWTSVISWCKERVGPLKIVQTCKPTDGPLNQRGRALTPSPQPKFCRLSSPRSGLFSWRSRRSPAATNRHGSVKRAGEGAWISVQHAYPSWRRASRWASLSACPAAFTVVWLTVGLLVGDADLRGQQWVGSLVLMNVFLSVDSGHLQSHLKNDVHWYFFFLLPLLLCPTSLTFVTFPHSSKMAAKTPSYVHNYGWSSNT